MEFKIYPIGYIENIDEQTSKITLYKKLSDGLEHLEKYSHIVVLYYLDRVPEKDRTSIKIQPSHDNIPILGIFATRFPARPNPIGLYVTELMGVVDNVITIGRIDAIDKTPVIDIKPFIPKFDSPKGKIKLPEWVKKHLKENRHRHKHNYDELRKMIVKRI